MGFRGGVFRSCKKKKGAQLFIGWLRMWNQSVHNYIERCIIVGLQCINPSLQRWMHIWEFSGAKTIDTDLQRCGENGQMSHPHQILHKWASASGPRECYLLKTFSSTIGIHLSLQINTNAKFFQLNVLWWNPSVLMGAVSSRKTLPLSAGHKGSMNRLMNNKLM